MLSPLLSCPGLICRHFPAVPMTTQTAAIYISSFIILTVLMLLLGDCVGTVKPIAILLLAQVHTVGVEVESGHISPSLQCPPPQVGPIVGGEGVQVLVKVMAGWTGALDN